MSEKHRMDKSHRTERLEARMTAEQKALLMRAAELGGRSLTDFVLQAAQEAARETIREHEATSAMVLGEQDRQAFVAALMEDAEPGDRLKTAAQRYRQETGV
ncbi:MAG: DUF1778 domain-containing protein [Thiohalospira sp.]